MQKNISFKVKGMQRDLSVSAFNSEYAYENKNVRIMPTDESTLFSLINEKGNKPTDISGVGSYIKGIPIGQSLINNELIIFTAGDDDYKTANITPDTFEAPDITIIDSSYELDIDVDSMFDDRIYKLWFNSSGALAGQRLFRGNLGFNYKYPIEAVSFYENSDIRKVYWTDGLNQPRVINVAAASSLVNKWDTDSFNFVKTLNLNESITITRSIVSSGNFPPGVIQYAFTYFNKYGQESNIFYTSPLYYISYNNRGASPESKVSNSFNIVVEEVDTKFDYLRIYSIHRTSLNATPTVKRVVDLAPSTGLQPYTLNEYDTYLTTNDINKIIIRVRGGQEQLHLSEFNPEYSGTDYVSYSINTLRYDRVMFPTGEYLSFGEHPNNSLYIVITNANRVTINLPPHTMTGYLNKTRATYTDNGASGDIIDPTELLYIGGEEVVFGTMTQKDNTLFLGDIQIKRKVIDSTIRNYFNGKTITFSNYVKSIESPEPKGQYPYNNQLKLNSYQFKTFKYLEYYRFGIQAQHYTGKWSEPIWINDAKNTTQIDATFYSSGKIGLPVAQFTLDDPTIIRRLLDQGYIRIRPVVVYPTINEREAVCQGILCPTVYNVADRYGNSPFAQSSWFVRPNAPFDVRRVYFEQDGTQRTDWKPLDGGLNPSIYSRAGVMHNDRTIVRVQAGEHLYHKYDMDVTNKGAWAEFRHNHPIPSNNQRNAEIQCIWDPPTRPYVSNDKKETEVADWVSMYSENFYIDQSILTFHSPDIEFDTEVRSIDTSGLKLRIVGIVPVTAFAADIDIQTSTPVNNFKDSSALPPGFYKEPFGAENGFYSDVGAPFNTKTYGDSHFGWRGLISGAFWFDEMVGYRSDVGNEGQYTTGFVVYPWHRNGSLNNTKYASDGYRSAMLQKKRLSNIRYSYKTQYINSDKIWNAYLNGSNERTGISGVAIFDSEEVSLTRLPAQENSGLTDINYYGNVDKLLTISNIGWKRDGYPIITTGTDQVTEGEAEEGTVASAHKLFSSTYRQVNGEWTSITTGVDPVRIKYKSTPHAVLALNYTKSGEQVILPTIQDWNVDYPSTTDIWNINCVGEDITSNHHLFWDKNKNIKKIYQEIITPGITGDISTIGGFQYGWLWLGELYNDNIQNRFGGQTDEAFENNIWLPCGDPISLMDREEGIKKSVTINWIEGDTYYQRYDHIKTYPFTTEDQNQVTDIISFMCETRVNIDGRYDRNRGQLSNFAITPRNFNLMNDVYSQQNNFFNYRTINPNKLNLDNFNNSITWTKTKTAGELIDTWTNITLASTLDLDGDKGDIRALRRFNNNILAFQDRGISQILYNESMQIASTEGVPIEIANSGKVNGKRYITDKIGCVNKWSICETPNGIYFIDDITKGIFLFNGQLNNISDKLGFHSWINKASNGINIWNPVDFDSFVTYYDKVNGDVFFINKEECLGYSEPLGQFTSFYSYEKMPYFSNLEDRGISFNVPSNSMLYRPWLHNEGDYNMFFGTYQPFHTTIIANPDMQADKIFNSLEFRADSWDKDGNLLNTTFDTLTTWNEYQEGITDLTNTPNRPSTLKKKFRIWRANIPRAKANGRDRMRNPWLYVKLSMEKENTNKTILHDMMVHYFE